MHKTTASLVRRTVATSAALFLMSGAVVASAPDAPAASAGNCSLRGLLCGKANNWTGRTMSITYSLGHGEHYCDVWNWGGGTTSEWKHARCKQKPVGNGTFGGNRRKGDVDAFTFANQGYFERFDGEEDWHWRTKGVWTKIQNHEYANCVLYESIWCTVKWQRT